MYNKVFQMVVSSVAAKERDVDDGSVIDIAVSGVLHDVKRDILADLDFGDNKPGLDILLDSDLPIKYPVHLSYMQRVDTEIYSQDFAGPSSDKKTKKKAGEDERKMQCRLTDVQVFEKNAEGFMQLKVKIALRDVKSDEAGAIVSSLKKTVDVKILATQTELFK